MTGPILLEDQGAFWVGVERVATPHGTVAAGGSCVQYQIPAERRHRWPLVMVHGGGGQGLEFLATPDGRPGWATWFLRRGHAVYVLDRPGLGRAPYHEAVYGPATPAPAYEALLPRFAAPPPAAYPQAALLTQWPGSGAVGDPVSDQFMAGQGSFVPDLVRTQEDMRRAAAALLDRIGPAVLLTHSMGGPFGWLAADARPEAVKGIVAVEPLGPPFAETPFGRLSWGLTAVPMAYDPPAADAAALRPETRPAPAPDLLPCLVQAEPARRLPRLRGIPIAVVTGEGSWKAQTDHGMVDFLRQAGAEAEHLRLAEHGVRGNGHLMMAERNSDEVAAVIAAWIERRVAG